MGNESKTVIRGQRGGEGAGFPQPGPFSLLERPEYPHHPREHKTEYRGKHLTGLG